MFPFEGTGVSYSQCTGQAAALFTVLSHEKARKFDTTLGTSHVTLVAPIVFTHLMKTRLRLFDSTRRDGFESCGNSKGRTG